MINKISSELRISKNKHKLSKSNGRRMNGIDVSITILKKYKIVCTTVFYIIIMSIRE